VIQVGMRSRSLSEGTSAGSSEANEEEKFLRGFGWPGKGEGLSSANQSRSSSQKGG